MKPRIAIPVPTSGDAAYNQRSWASYGSAVERSGGEPLAIALDATRGEILALAATCVGVCLPGSPADVEPALYGADRDPASAPADPAREAVDFVLLEAAYAHRNPVLAICYGMQSLNVWRGGTLVQDLTPVPVNHSAGGKVAVAHSTLIAEDSLLAALLTATPETAAEAPTGGTLSQAGFLRLPINTSHHQAVSSPGEGLRIVARCPDDGVVEAIEGDPAFEAWDQDNLRTLKPPAFVLGVQWHPERSFDISPASRALFARLVAEAARARN